MLMLLCTFFVSTVQATDEINSAPAPDNQTLLTNEPNQISTGDNSTSDNPTLIAPRENSTETDTSITSGDGPTANSLISTKTSPDYTIYLVLAVVLAAAIVVLLCIVVLGKRKA